MPVTHVCYTLFDVSGNPLETKTEPLTLALRAIADFINILVVDPEENGAGSQGGRISFEPAATPPYFQLRCPDCGVEVGELHEGTCDVERCAECGTQRISCDCDDDNPLCWTGVWPGVAECEEFGWWSIRNPNGPGWLSVPAGTKGATHDLNRLYRDALWDKDIRRWVKKDGC